MQPQPEDVVVTTIAQKLHTIEINSKEDFAKIYSTIIGCLLDLSPASVAILNYCTQCYHFSNNMIVFVPKVMEKISIQGNVTEKEIKQGLKQLTDLKVLTYKGSKAYQIQKSYCWAGPERVSKLHYNLDISFKEEI